MQNYTKLYLVSLFIVVSTMVLIGYGGLLRHSYMGGTSFPHLQTIARFLADIPSTLKPENLARYFSPEQDLNIKSQQHAPKNIAKITNSQSSAGFDVHSKIDRPEMLLLSRYDGNKRRSVVEIVDLNTFDVIHAFYPNISKINKFTDQTREEFKRLEIDRKPDRYRMIHPIITPDLGLIFHHSSPLVKIDFCGNIIWVNDEDVFHHSIEVDADGHYWVPTETFPYSLDPEHVGNKYGSFDDDAITQITNSGKILFSKTVSSILIENGMRNLIHRADGWRRDPLHLNDIQPALKNGEFWKKGDLFLSLKHVSLILHYRPSTNELIKVVKGPFSAQHDVDILDNGRLSIFDNNWMYFESGPAVDGSNQIEIYNYGENSFVNAFKEEIEHANMITAQQGLAEFLSDGSLFFEATEIGSAMIINASGQVEWKYTNKSEDGQQYMLNWSRILDDRELIKKIRERVKKKECLN